MLSRNSVTGLLIFVISFAVFRLSPNHQVFDSTYTMFFSQHLLRDGSFSVARDAIPALDGVADAKLQRGVTLPYHLEQVGERIYYYFPPGSVLLSAPYVALINLSGVAAEDSRGRYFAPGEVEMQRWLAAFLMAALAVVVFQSSRVLLSLEWSACLAAATAFGTQIWSTASRAVMADTWGVFLSAVAVWLIMRAEAKRVPHRPVLLATLLSWLYFCKPTYCVAIVAVSIYLALFHRRILLPYMLAGAAWLAAFVAWSEYHFVTLLPLYYRADRLTWGEGWEALAGNLISPSRGLLIFVPVLWFVGYLLVRYWRWQEWRRLVWLAVGITGFHLLVIAGHVPWRGGHAFGPRLTTSLVPWFALLAVLALDARQRFASAARERQSSERARLELAIGALLVTASIFIHAIGAISDSALQWNATPVDVEARAERVWTWSDAQFLAPFVTR